MGETRTLHVGIIPDGTRRWATRHLRGPLWDGHEAGEKAEEILLHLADHYPAVRDVTIWAMSVENFQRSRRDQERVFQLLATFLARTATWERAQARLSVVGSMWQAVPADLRHAIADAQQRTRHYTERRLTIGLGYGGQQEIVHAATSVAEQRQTGQPPDLTTAFEQSLLVPRPLDLVIRTGGEQRLSGFCLYQAAYAELFFVETLWPDFTVTELDRLMAEFARRERRFGR
ncbi:MAG: di-trans,poly-cis-decaprenylcistransferase [Deltaproteobacteria bacterium]|nr:di-trans,poly-cis-decaprenylcistransferase [Deltaproteobacteria bacterium]